MFCLFHQFKTNHEWSEETHKHSEKKACHLSSSCFVTQTYKSYIQYIPIITQSMIDWTHSTGHCVSVIKLCFVYRVSNCFEVEREVVCIVGEMLSRVETPKKQIWQQQQITKLAFVSNYWPYRCVVMNYSNG